ncbi:MAG: ATP-binding protein, partial [Candidatus Saccharibacteria bacterium]|nr:ATP-binding protein [Candidatus Saccharibacteria bacterium]
NYEKKLSGPLLDRIDITIPISAPNKSVLFNSTTTSTLEHANAKLQIKRALNKQFNRYQDHQKTNASLASYEVTNYIKLTKTAKELLNDAANRYQLSARAYFKVIKVAQTIADIAEDDSLEVTKAHIAEALHFRNNLA